MNPGIFDWSHADYHGDKFCPVPSLAAGIADALVNQTPLHAWTRHRRLNKDYVEQDDKKFDVGTAAHALLLEGIDRMAVCDFADWRTKASKEARAEAIAQGKTAVLPHQADRILKMVMMAKRAFIDCADLKGYSMGEGQAEKSLAWKEGETWLRCRPDWMSADRKIIMDAKFTDTDAGPEPFANQIARMAYDLRASFYLRGNAVLGGHPEAVYLFMVQEARPPYATCFVGMPPAYIELGNQKVGRAIALWSKCMRDNKWPGYPNHIFWPDPPAWAMNKWEDTGLIPGTGTFDMENGDIPL